MAIGLIGKKVGMSRVFTEEGRSVPVTVVQIPANCVTQTKTEDRDGYMALQLSAYQCNPKKLNKARAGHFAKTKSDAYLYSKEFRIDEKETQNVGDMLDVGVFEAGQKVKVTGISKGKGFAGTIKRHNFRGQDRSHGNSISHRVPGSTGQCQTPGRVFKGKKMAGRMGGAQTTLINCEVVMVDADKELLLLKGSVPGAPDGQVIIQHLEHIDLQEQLAKSAAPAEEAPAEEALAEEIVEEQAEEQVEEKAEEQAAEEVEAKADADEESAAPDAAETPEGTKDEN